MAGDILEFSDGNKAAVTSVSGNTIQVDEVPAGLTAGAGVKLLRETGNQNIGWSQ